MAGVGQRLEIRQGQSLVMTPQLQQAIRLLQLSALELEQELGIHSAASAMAGLRARSTTLSVVRMRWVVPSWKRITVSTGMLASPR